MLTRLFIQNLATVEKQIVDLNPGFSALTGETGAGKSIIVKAIHLILGEKCSKELIRADTDFLSVEAVFNISENEPVKRILKALDIEFEDELTIRRKVHRNGKSSLFVNDYTTKLTHLAELGQHLIDLHGQHSQQALLQSAVHIDYLDQFAGLNKAVTEYGEVYREWLQKRKLKKELAQSAAERNQKLDFIRFQIDEIEQAGFTEEEERELIEEANTLTHAEQIIDTLSPIADWHSGNNPLLSEIATVSQSLKNILKVSPDLENFASELQSGLITLEEVASDVQQYLSGLEVNPDRLEAVNERLSVLDGLKRKYGQTLPEINRFLEDKRQELDQLNEIEIEYGELEGEIAALAAKTAEMADRISAQRLASKEPFEDLVAANLRELGMEKCLFSIDLQQLPMTEDGQPTFQAKGKDRVEFLIATNPGNPLKPLAKVASGGEISRIMLAIKTSLNEDLTKGTMVFDEVDAGISGRVAEIVGLKLDKLGSRRQVICITHSPQIASKAGNHYRVAKIVADDSSKTMISQLSPDERVEEIARFLGGNEITDKTLSAAREMIDP